MAQDVVTAVDEALEDKAHLIVNEDAVFQTVEDLYNVSTGYEQEA
jgi:hypothetical protein